jgi:hypothetical protein
LYYVGSLTGNLCVADFGQCVQIWDEPRRILGGSDKMGKEIGEVEVIGIDREAHKMDATYRSGMESIAIGM